MSIEQLVREIVRDEMSKAADFATVYNVLDHLVTRYPQIPKPIGTHKITKPYMPREEMQRLVESKAVWTLAELQAATPAKYSNTPEAWRGRLNRMRRNGSVGIDQTGKIYALAK